jgi:protein-disulfide isomerase
MSYQARLRVPVSDEDHSEGPQAAPLTMVEYGDFECPYCGRAYPIVRELQRGFGNDLRFVFRHFPLRHVHYRAMAAAKACEAAGLQGRFREAFAFLFEHQRTLGEDAFFGFAASQGLDAKRFALDMESPAVERRILKDIEGGVRSGVNGTPTFFINGVRYDGDWSLEPLRSALLESAAVIG